MAKAKKKAAKKAKKKSSCKVVGARKCLKKDGTLRKRCSRLPGGKFKKCTKRKKAKKR